MGLIEDVRTKCEEIQEQVDFIYTLAGKGLDPKWVLNDPGYTHLKAVYDSARASLDTLVSELPL